MREVFKTAGPVVIYPASGTGAWEAALVNTLSPGDKVIASETGHFATLWREMAVRLGLDVVWLEGDWRHGADPERIADALDDDVRAVMVVHNETSTGVTSRIADVRAAHRRSRRAAARGHDLVAREHRLPARRVGRRRHRRRLAEGPDAAGRPELQRDLREGAGGVEGREAAALVLGLDADRGRERGRLLAVHERDEPALRAARGAPDPAARGRARQRVRAPRAARGGDPRGRARAGGSRCWRSTSASSPAR